MTLVTHTQQFAMALSSDACFQSACKAVIREPPPTRPENCGRLPTDLSLCHWLLKFVPFTLFLSLSERQSLSVPCTPPRHGFSLLSLQTVEKLHEMPTSFYEAGLLQMFLKSRYTQDHSATKDLKWFEFWWWFYLPQKVLGVVKAPPGIASCAQSPQSTGQNWKASSRYLANFIKPWNSIRAPLFHSSIVLRHSLVLEVLQLRQESFPCWASEAS